MPQKPGNAILKHSRIEVLSWMRKEGMLEGRSHDEIAQLLGLTGEQRRGVVRNYLADLDLIEAMTQDLYNKAMERYNRRGNQG